MEDVLAQLPNDAVRSALLEVIAENVPTDDYKIEMEKGSAKGDNYIGVLQRLCINYKIDDTAEEQKLGMYIKVPPLDVSIRKYLFVRPCFLRESLIYEEFLPLVDEFQRSKGIDVEKNGFYEIAKCYKNLTNDLEEAILMEDLGQKGYIMHNRFEVPSVDLTKVAVRGLAKLHALSFALKDQMPEKFAKFKDIDEIFATKKDDDRFVSSLNSGKDLACSSVSGTGDEEYHQRVSAFFEKKTIFEHLLELTVGSRAEPYAVVCHGDCWNNNFLFKYENGKAVDCKLIDWQIARFSSPVCDLMYYVGCSTLKAMRDEHLDEILDTYYSEFTAFLQRLGSDPEKLFPRSAFDDQLKQFGAFALVMGLIALPATISKPEDFPDMKDAIAKMEAGDKEYEKKYMEMKKKVASPRIRDIIIDLVRLGYI